MIIEGVHDTGVFEELIRRTVPSPSEVSVKEAGGKQRLMARLPRWLRMFEHWTAAGGAVDRAVVVRDANGEDPAAVEARMRARIKSLTYAFRHGVELHAIKQETETWLLADPAAIEFVAQRAGAITPPDPVESLNHAKDAFMDVLTDVGLLYAPETCRQIAARMDIARLACCFRAPERARRPRGR